jgi:hypothetical protein
MDLTPGQMMAIFLLLSSRSKFRFRLEGRKDKKTSKPFVDVASFIKELKSALDDLDIDISKEYLDAIDANHPLVSLFVLDRNKAGVPDRQIGNVSTDHNEFISALGLNQIAESAGDPPLYTDDNPCPDGQQQIDVAQAIADSIGGAVLVLARK